MRERTEVLAGRFTPRERKVVEAQARKDGIGPSEYVRASVMTMLLLDGNVEAAKITAELARLKFQKFLAEHMPRESVPA